MKLCPQCGKQYPDTTMLCTQDGRVLQSADDPLIGLTLAEKYLVETLIKRGGMGAVYRGKHVLMDKVVAIKVLRPSLAADQDVVTRFSREAKAASRISHPHAVSVTDFGEAENGVVFLVMEYLDGRTLKDKIRSEGPMSLERAVETVRQIAGALDAAHAQGVIHRDLKSDNVMLVRHDGGDWAKVLDFGIAKIQQPEGQRDIDLTAPNVVIGTPQYMSPEQCSESKTIDARSDVYSLGIILFEVLAGHVPFTGESSTSIMMKHVMEPPPSVLAFRSDLPVGISDVLARALAKQPEDRFQSAGELAEALARVSDGENSTSTAGTVTAASRTRTAMTVPITPIGSPTDDFDEVTLVRTPQLRDHSRELAPQQAMGFNLSKVIIPSSVALLLVFLGVFLLTRNSGQTQSNVNQYLTVDPNGQPVQAGSPPTGESERGVHAIPVGTPVSENINANANQNSALPDANPNNDSLNKNDNQAREAPSIKPGPSVTASPPAAPAVKPSAEPPQPKPSPTVETVVLKQLR